MIFYHALTLNLRWMTGNLQWLNGCECGQGVAAGNPRSRA
jgi:hypothetical protein